MKSLKPSRGIFLGVLLGALIGALISHASVAKAAQLKVLSLTPIENPDKPQDVGFTGVTVVGFSCIPDPSHPGHGICYILSH
jgi:hypothetical protein